MVEINKKPLLTSQRINSPDRWVNLLETDHYLEGGGEGLSRWRTWPSSLWSTFVSYSLPFLSSPGILLTIFTIAARLPSSQTLPNWLLELTHKLSRILISEMFDSIKFQYTCIRFRNCCLRPYLNARLTIRRQQGNAACFWKKRILKGPVKCRIMKNSFTWRQKSFRVHKQIFK